MAPTPARPAHDGAAFHDRLSTRRVRLVALIPILLLAAILVGRANLVTQRPTAISLAGVAASDLSPDELKAVAADVLDGATTGDGTGYTFEIVQRSAIHVADGSDAHELGTYLERGFLTPDGYFAEIRRGPDDPDAKPDFGAGTIEMRALVRDGVTWRDDGDGWYQTDKPPGLGLDPATALLLPTLLRETTAAKDEGKKPVDDIPARVVSAEAEVADIPGVIAVDLAEFTDLTAPVELAFDEAGRLVELTVVARNTKLEGDDLIVTTVISLDYPLLEPGLPEPDPVVATPSPASDDEGES
jgi:hypothetical protein